MVGHEKARIIKTEECRDTDMETQRHQSALVDDLEVNLASVATQIDQSPLVDDLEMNLESVVNAQSPLVDDLVMNLQSALVDDLEMKESVATQIAQSPLVDEESVASEIEQSPLVDDVEMKLESLPSYMGSVSSQNIQETEDLRKRLKPVASYVRSESGQNFGIQEHDNSKDLNMLTAAYLLAKGNTSSYQNFPELSKNAFLQLKSPLDSTLLHIAASHGNDEVVKHVLQENPNYLEAINMNGDTPLQVAARAGHDSTVQILLAAYVHSLRAVQLSAEDILRKTLDFTMKENKQGNNMFHEASIRSSLEGDKIFKVFEAPIIADMEVNNLLPALIFGAALNVENKEGKSALYLAIEAGYKELVIRILEHCSKDALPAGKSPFLAAFMKRDADMLHIILSRKPEWKHLRGDKGGRTPLHYAASIGYLKGVRDLLENCASCSLERDSYGFFPLHLASDGGHIEVVVKLLQYCPDPFEMLDFNGQNILHIAAQSGNLNVVWYILQAPELEKMINQKDQNGNTPLHLASLHCHPKVVHALTRDKRVDLALKNRENQTALDAALKVAEKNPSLRQRLTWIALKSAGAQPAGPPGSTTRIPLRSTEHKKSPNMENYKDRIDTLIVLSTLIITATFAAGFTMPGGNNDSDPGQGMAKMLNHNMFHLYIISITISMYGAISVTIILIWARLGDLYLVLLALRLASYLLGLTLFTLSLAFLAGVYLVISQLHVLATTFLVLGTIFIFMLLLLYALLWFPSSSSIPVFRCISYYPFIFLASVAEGEVFGN